jgi:hypothetical protein
LLGPIFYWDSLGGYAGGLLPSGAQGIEAEILFCGPGPQKRLQRKARFFCPFAGQKNAPKF